MPWENESAAYKFSLVCEVLRGFDEDPRGWRGTLFSNKRMGAEDTLMSDIDEVIQELVNREMLRPLSSSEYHFETTAVGKNFLIDNSGKCAEAQRYLSGTEIPQKQSGDQITRKSNVFFLTFCIGLSVAIVIYASAVLQ